MTPMMSSHSSVNSMHSMTDWNIQYTSKLFTPFPCIAAIDLLNKLIYIQNGRYLALLAVRTCLVSSHFLLRSQGDSTRQRHGDGCRVPVSHHLFINLKSFTYNSISEDADVFFSLYDTREAKQIRYMEDSEQITATSWPACCCMLLLRVVAVRMQKAHAWLHTRSLFDWGVSVADWPKLWPGLFCSEKFMVKLNKNGGPKNPEKIDRLCALFTVTSPSLLLPTNTNACCISTVHWHLSWLSPFLFRTWAVKTWRETSTSLHMS